MCLLVQDTKAFVQHRLGPLAPSGSLLIKITFRTLEPDRCFLTRHAGRNRRAAGGDICLQKYVGDPIEGVEGTEVFHPYPHETNEHPCRVVAGVCHIMSVPIDRHGAALSQEDLTTRIHAMASTHVDAVEPRCDGVQFVEKPARFVGKWPAKIGKAPPVS